MWPFSFSKEPPAWIKTAEDERKDVEDRLESARRMQVVAISRGDGVGAEHWGVTIAGLMRERGDVISRWV